MTVRTSLPALALFAFATFAAPMSLAEEVPAQACTGLNCLPEPTKPADVCKGADCAPPTPQEAEQCEGQDCQPIEDQVTPGPEDQKVEPTSQ